MQVHIVMIKRDGGDNDPPELCVFSKKWEAEVKVYEILLREGVIDEKDDDESELVNGCCIECGSGYIAYSECDVL